MPWSTGMLKKNSVQIVSQNAHGLKSNERIKEITKSKTLKDRDIFTTCLQERWRVGEEVFDINNSKFILYCLNQADQSLTGSQGVGFILNQEAIKAWKDGGCELYKISARIIALRLLLEDRQKKTVGLFLVSAYKPVGVADETQWDVFLNDLEECVSKKRPDDLLLIYNRLRHELKHGLLY